MQKHYLSKKKSFKFQAKLSTLRAAEERSVSGLERRAAGGGGGIQQATRRATTSLLR